MLLSIDLLSYHLRRAGWSRFISTFLLFYAQIIATEFFLGLFSILNSQTLVFLNILVSTTIVLVLYKKFGGNIYGNYLIAAKKTITTAWKLVIKDPLWSILVFLATAFVAWIIFLGVLFPANDFDGYSYHLTFVANLIQNQNFYDTPTSLSWLAGYPKGGEFIQAWSVLITNNDILSDLAQIPFLILGIYALYKLALRIGADKMQARFAAVLFVFIPVVLNQLKTTYVDVMLTSLFFAGLVMVTRQKLGKLDFVLMGIIFSLLISLKPTGVLFVFVLFPLLGWNLYKVHGRKISNYFTPFLLLILPAFFGLYWYIKNLVIYGSPIYPFGFKVAGINIFPGKTFKEFAATAVESTSLPSGCLDRIWFVWTEQKDWFGCLYNYDTNYAGLGPIWFIILLPAIIVSIFFAIKKRNYLFLAITALLVALFAIYPSNYYSRYTMFITAVGILALSLTLTHIKRFVQIPVKLLAIVLVFVVIATNFVLCNFPPEMVKEQIKSLRAGSVRGDYYAILPGEAFIELEDKLRPGDVVEYDSKPFFIYPLWNKDFSNKVIYIPVANKNEWHMKIQEKSVDYVFTTLSSRENNWADDSLKSIYKDELYEIFQVN